MVATPSRPYIVGACAPLGISPKSPTARNVNNSQGRFVQQSYRSRPRRSHHTRIVRAHSGFYSAQLPFRVEFTNSSWWQQTPSPRADSNTGFPQAAHQLKCPRLLKSLELASMASLRLILHQGSTSDRGTVLAMFSDSLLPPSPPLTMDGGPSGETGPGSALASLYRWFLEACNAHNRHRYFLEPITHDWSGCLVITTNTKAWPYADIYVAHFNMPRLPLKYGGSPSNMELLAIAAGLELVDTLELMGTVYTDCQDLERKPLHPHAIRRNSANLDLHPPAPLAPHYPPMDRKLGHFPECLVSGSVGTTARLTASAWHLGERGIAARDCKIRHLWDFRWHGGNCGRSLCGHCQMPPSLPPPYV